MKYFYRGTITSVELDTLVPSLGSVYFNTDNKTYWVCTDGISYMRLCAINELQMCIAEKPIAFGSLIYDNLVFNNKIGPFAAERSYLGKIIRYSNIYENIQKCKFAYCGHIYTLSGDSYQVLSTSKYYSNIVASYGVYFDFFRQKQVEVTYDSINGSFRSKRGNIIYDIFGCDKDTHHVSCLIPNVKQTYVYDINANIHQKQQNTFWRKIFHMKPKLDIEWIEYFMLEKKQYDMVFDFLTQAWCYVVSKQGDTFYLSNGDVCNEYGLSIKQHPDYVIPLYLNSNVCTYNMKKAPEIWNHTSDTNMIYVNRFGDMSAQHWTEVIKHRDILNDISYFKIL